MGGQNKSENFPSDTVYILHQLSVERALGPLEGPKGKGSLSERPFGPSENDQL